MRTVLAAGRMHCDADGRNTQKGCFVQRQAARGNRQVSGGEVGVKGFTWRQELYVQAVCFRRLRRCRHYHRVPAEAGGGKRRESRIDQGWHGGTAETHEHSVHRSDLRRGGSEFRLQCFGRGARDASQLSNGRG